MVLFSFASTLSNPIAANQRSTSGRLLQITDRTGIFAAKLLDFLNVSFAEANGFGCEKRFISSERSVRLSIIFMPRDNGQDLVSFLQSVSSTFS